MQVIDAKVLCPSIEQLDDGRYLGRCARLPGLNVQGDSIEQVIRLARKVARALIAAMRFKGVPLPPSLMAARSSLRVDPVLTPPSVV